MSKNISLLTHSKESREEGPVFPLEIFEKIINAIPRYRNYRRLIGWEHRTFQSCSLVCKDFVRLARPFLFHHVYAGGFYFGGRPRKDSRLAAILHESSYVSSYLRCLTYLPEARFPDSKEVQKEDFSILLRLPRLHYLSVSCRLFSNPDATYQDVPATTFGHRQLLETYLPIGRLTTLSISHCDGLPLNLLLSSSGLRSLKLSSCHLSLEGMKLDGSHVATYRLTRLTLIDVANVPISTLLSPKSCLYLKTICLASVKAAPDEASVVWERSKDGVFDKLEHMTMDAQGACKNFVEAAALGGGIVELFPALRKLSVKPGSLPDETDETYNELFPLFTFPKLEEVSITGSMGSIDIFNLTFDQCLQECKRTVKKLSFNWDALVVSNPEYVIEDLIPGLRNIPMDNVIETIELIIRPSFACDWDLEKDDDVEEEIHHPNFEGWQALDELLLQTPSPFPCLRSFFVLVQFNPRGSYPNRKLEKFIGSYLQFDRFMWLAGILKTEFRSTGELAFKCEFLVEVLHSEQSSFRLNPDSDSLSFSDAQWLKSESYDTDSD